MTVAVAVLAATVFGSDKFDGLRASDKAPGSIIFSRESGEFTRISDTLSSTSGRTSNGATYYAIAHSNGDVSETGYVAQFGSGASTEDQFIRFSSSATSDVDFEFQRLTGIKVKTTSGSAQTLYAYYSDDGVNFSGYHSVSCSSNPEKFTFTSPHKYVRLGEYSVYARNIVEIELFYECGDVDPDPEPKEVDHLTFGSMKSRYVLGDEFEEPEVIAWYTDESHETVEASFSAVDMTVTGKQTVTATYSGVNKNFTIEVWPSATACRVSYKGLFLDDYSETETGAFLKESSILPAYGEPTQTVSFAPIMKDAYVYVDVYDESGDLSFSYDGTTASFTMPNSDVEIYIVYQTSPYKLISYVGFDLGTYDSASTSVFLDSSSTVPAYAEPGDTVSVTPVAKSGYAIDGVVDMNEDVTISESAGVYSFTMPNYNFEVTILFHEVVTLESIYVVSPKTTYTVGSSFVIPTVKGVYSNGAEEALEVTVSNFSGFDSSVAVASQTITVSYPGVSSVTYTIEIVESQSHVLSGTYIYSATLNQGANEFRLIFNSDGTGAFERDFTPTATGIKEEYGLSFVFDDSAGTSFTITLVSFYEGTPHSNSDDIRTAFFTRYPFIYRNGETTNSTGVINADGSIKIKLTSSTSTSAGSFYTFTK